MPTEQQAPTLSGIRNQISRLATVLHAIERDLDTLSTHAATLEPVTDRPASTSDTAFLTSPAVAPAPSRGFRIGGQFYCCQTCKAVYLGVLRHLWTSCPSRREQLARASRVGAHTRRYLAQSRQLLFPNRPSDWSRIHSSPISDGWYADTNLNSTQMRTILHRVICAANLPCDSGIEIEWYRPGRQRKDSRP